MARVRSGFGRPPMPHWIGGGTGGGGNYPPWEPKPGPPGTPAPIPPRYPHPRTEAPPLPVPGEHTAESELERLIREMEEYYANQTEAGPYSSGEGTFPETALGHSQIFPGGVVWVRAEEERLRELI